MDTLTQSPDELEARADHVRGKLGATIDSLRQRLTPRNLVDEITDRSGVRQFAPSSMFDFAARRHPVTTVLVGLGAALLAFSAVKAGGKAGSGSIRETLDELSQSARQAFKDRAEAKRRDFVQTAQAHLSTGVDQLGDAVERGIGDFVSRMPAPAETKPLIESAVQILLVAAIETLLRKTVR